MRLGVNIDHVATLRQQRREDFPDPVEAALVAQKSGADSIVAHLREDRRHIQDHDIRRLKKVLRIPLAMEMAATEEMMRIALDVRPARVCLVPEKRQELTTEGGLDVIKHQKMLMRMVPQFLAKDIEVSLFVDPNLNQIRQAHEVGADTVELHTGRYAKVQGRARLKELNRLRAAAKLSRDLGLRLHAGHGLDYDNVQSVAKIAGMQELNIGFSIVTRSVFDGLGKAVQQMKELMTCAA